MRLVLDWFSSKQIHIEAGVSLGESIGCFNFIILFFSSPLCTSPMHMWVCVRVCFSYFLSVENCTAHIVSVWWFFNELPLSINHRGFSFSFVLWYKIPHIIHIRALKLCSAECALLIRSRDSARRIHTQCTIRARTHTPTQKYHSSFYFIRYSTVYFILSSSRESLIDMISVHTMSVKCMHMIALK